VTAPELLNTGSTFEVQHETTDTSISPTMTCRTPKSIQGSSRRISHSESAPATPSNNTRKGPASSLSVVTAPELLSVGSTFDENTDKFMTPTMTYRTPKSCRGSYSEKVGGTSSSSRRYSYSNRPSPRIASMEEIRHFLGVKLQQLEKDQAKIKQEETQAQSCEPEETSAYKNETEEDDDVQKEIPVDNNNNEVESNNIALSSPTKSSTDSTVASTATASTLVEA
jgi:hypothetical protein